MEFVPTAGSNNCCLDRQCKHGNLRGEEKRGKQFARNHLRETFRLLSVLGLPFALFFLLLLSFSFLFFFFLSGPFSPTRAVESANSILPATSIHLHSLFRLLIPSSQSSLPWPVPSQSARFMETDSTDATRRPEIPHKSSDSGSNPIFHGRKLVPNIILSFYQFFLD